MRAHVCVVEKIWDKGDASGLVIYTDAIYWESNGKKGVCVC